MALLDETLGGILGKRERSNRLRRLTINPPETVDFSSNDYLSVASNTWLQKEIISRLEARVHAAERGEAAKGILGSGGSRLLDGNSTFAEEVEQKIAAFHGASAGLLFNSAYDANVGLLSCVPQLGDIVVYDEAIHASVHEGMRLSRAIRKVPFAHSSVTDGDSESCRGGVTPGIEQVLQQVTAHDEGKEMREGLRNVFVCVEGIYSMDGTIVHLEKVVEMTKKYLPLHNGHIIVDEAHSIGVLGKQGRGLVSELGLEGKVSARVHGFGKAMGCAGGKKSNNESYPSFDFGADALSFLAT
ncbi:8-amino-7-oxononanoate synthase [Seiridium cupressi]